MNNTCTLRQFGGHQQQHNCQTKHKQICFQLTARYLVFAVTKYRHPSRGHSIWQHLQLAMQRVSCTANVHT